MHLNLKFPDSLVGHYNLTYGNYMIKLQANPFYKGLTSPLFTDEQASAALAFHKKINGYKETPLVSLKALAAHIGVKIFL